MVPVLAGIAVCVPYDDRRTGDKRSGGLDLREAMKTPDKAAFVFLTEALTNVAMTWQTTDPAELRGHIGVATAAAGLALQALDAMLGELPCPNCNRKIGKPSANHVCR